MHSSRPEIQVVAHLTHFDSYRKVSVKHYTNSCQGMLGFHSISCFCLCFKYLSLFLIWLKIFLARLCFFRSVFDIERLRVFFLGSFWSFGEISLYDRSRWFFDVFVSYSLVCLNYFTKWVRSPDVLSVWFWYGCLEII